MPVAHVHEVLNHIAPPLQAPSAQSDGANLYTGGPPIINYFSVSPAGPLWPGRQIELHWSVEGADAVEIVARDVAGSAPQELPPLAGPLPWVGPSSTTVTVPGSRAWRGLYVLRAKNRCTGTAAVEDALQVEMVLRRGSPSGAAAPEATSRSARCSTSTTRRDSGLTLSPPPRSDLSTLLVWLWGTTTQQRRPRP
jgi:hypothetical protein